MVKIYESYIKLGLSVDKHPEKETYNQSLQESNTRHNVVCSMLVPLKAQ